MDRCTGSFPGIAGLSQRRVGDGVAEARGWGADEVLQSGTGCFYLFLLVMRRWSGFEKTPATMDAVVSRMHWAQRGQRWVKLAIWKCPAGSY